MSLKDKCAIVIVIILLSIIGFVVTGNVKADSGTINMENLTIMARDNVNDFLNIDANSLAGKPLTMYTNAVYHKSAMCMYHKNSNASGTLRSYKIFNVLDFDFEDGFVLYNNRSQG